MALRLTKHHIGKAKKSWRKKVHIDSCINQSLTCTAVLMMETMFVFTSWVLTVAQLVQRKTVERLKIT